MKLRYNKRNGRVVRHYSREIHLSFPPKIAELSGSLESFFILAPGGA
ncbi:hypothetical protein HMPREF0239_03739 [Clostridium sp. ATCC BAA-442]|nr:hypothetical protein HMPREF0239_03739 [Clostridium sp. ATCC BAA-442]